MRSMTAALFCHVYVSLIRSVLGRQRREIFNQGLSSCPLELFRPFKLA